MTTILITDDEPETRKMVEKCLAPCGFNVFLAKDGIECLDILSKNLIDILILDISMPGKDGIQVLEELRRSGRINKIKIAMLTAHRDSETVRRAISLGVEDFLLKPVNYQQLAERISLHAFHPSIDQVRALMKTAHVYDSKIRVQPGIDNVDSNRFLYFPMQEGKMSLCVKVPFGVIPSSYADRSDETLLQNVEVYGRAGRWVPLWPTREDAEKLRIGNAIDAYGTGKADGDEFDQYDFDEYL